uniref:hypothetical chloroplast RF1 n=1 Tax=Pilea cavernicola TaxID=2998964 RepID=UPI0023F59358|nr:hypothetical chloroplast RF1 [Pilea cavernicola]WDS80991.1 hypothetical chloroplast RF1 [Pilea cavernicola]
MIFQSFLLGNLVSLCMKIINSVVVVGLYYGFLTTFSIGPSYLFLLRARVMEEGTEKKVSATTGFITGQLMMFISIYYVPLHLAFGRPHTITVLALPYLLFHFFWNNRKHFFDYRSTNRNSMRNLSIQCVFLNNLIFQLFNHFILPSSMLVRLVNIYMFRCNNKMLFVTSSFVGWLIGHILFMKWVGLVLVWIQKNNSIRSNKYLVSELRNFRARIFSILLFITCVYYLDSPILTEKLRETSESEEETDLEIETTSETRGTKQEQEGFTELKIFKEKKDFHRFRFGFEKLLVTNLFDYKHKDLNGMFRFIENDKFEYAIALKNEMSQYFFHTSQSAGKERISFTHPPSLSTFFEMIQRKISRFTTQKTSYDELYNHWNSNKKEKRKNLNNIFINRLKALDKTFGSKSITLDGLEKKNRFFKSCNNAKKKYLYDVYDPFLNGASRGQILLYIWKRNWLSIDDSWLSINYNWILTSDTKRVSPPIKDEEGNWVSFKDYRLFLLRRDRRVPLEAGKRYKKKKGNSLKRKRKRGYINKIYGLFLIFNHLEFQQKKKEFKKIYKKSLEKKISFLFNLMNEFPGKPTSSLNLLNLIKNYLLGGYKQVIIDSEGRNFIFLFERVETNPNNKKTRKLFIGLKEITKKVLRQSYIASPFFEPQEGEGQEGEDQEGEDQEGEDRNLWVDPTLESRNYKRRSFLTYDLEDEDMDYIPNSCSTDICLIRYLEESDFRRDIMVSSMASKRRKTVISKVVRNVQSPTFLEQKAKFPSFYKDFKNWLLKMKSKEADTKEEYEIEDYEIIEKALILQSTGWYFENGQQIRVFLVVTKSILRKYIILPSLIIIKNIGRILLFQRPEWSEDFRDWWKEIHVLCTYNGIPFFEHGFFDFKGGVPKFKREFLQSVSYFFSHFSLENIHIKILFPFRLKPWHKPKLRKRANYPLKNKEKKTEFWFVRSYGIEIELRVGSTRKQLSFFKPIFKELKKKLIKLKKKLKNKCFPVLINLKKIRKFFLNLSKELKKRIIKKILFLKKKKLKKSNQILLFELKEIYELSENKKEKNLIIKNTKIDESYINIHSTNYIAFFVTKTKIQQLTDIINRIINQIQKISKANKKEFRNLHINISSNKISYDNKRLGSPKTILQLLKKNVQLIRKTNSVINLFVEKVHLKIFLYMSHFYRKNEPLFFSFFEATKKKYNKYSFYNNYIYNIKTNKEKMDKTNKNGDKLISLIKRKESLSNISNNQLNTLRDSSYLSQDYVFYKLSQILFLNVFNLYKLRLKSVFQSNVTSLFLKNEIKNFFFGTQKLFHSKLRHKNLRNFRIIHQCKNRLKVYYKSQFVPQESRNIRNRHPLVQKKHLNKYFSYEKYRFLNFEKQKNVKKQDRYDLFSYNFIKSEDKKNSVISGLSLQVNYNQYIFYNYDEKKRQFVNMLLGMAVNNYLLEKNILDIKKDRNRKSFDWILLNFFFRKKRNIGTCTTSNSDTRQTYLGFNYVHINCDLVNFVNEKWNHFETRIFFFTVFDQIKGINPSKKTQFDWMRLNYEEMLNLPIINFELWFFPDFLRLSNSSQIKPWNIPIKWLLFNLKRKRKRYTYRWIMDFFLSSLSFLLTRDLLCQLRCSFSLNSKNSKTVNILKKCWHEGNRLMDSKEIAIDSRQTRELIIYLKKVRLLESRTMNLIQSLLLKRGILFIEPFCLSIKKKGQFIMHQTISISVVQNSNYTINQRDKKKGHVDKKTSDKFIPKHQKTDENRAKNHYDLFVPESILSPRRRRELRSLISFYSMNRSGMPLNTTFFNANSPVLNKIKRANNSKLKSFLWPSYRLENFACLNRYWFDTNNGSRFSMLRIRMYPQFENELNVY